MDEGRIVERGPTSSVLDAPKHPATQALVEATPNLDAAIARRQAMANTPTSAANARHASRNTASARWIS